MCGLIGAVGPSAAVAASRAICDTLAHRGPDGEGTYRDPRGGAALGHRRLAILDLSAAGHQPMTSPDGRFTLVLNGEIYNYLELRRELETVHAFRSATDTEVLLAAWMRWGEGALERLRGMFAFLVWDSEEGCLWAIRDRFGVKPLYQARLGDGTLVLASEISALHAAGVPREPDPVAWAEYLTHGRHELPDRTFWRDVRPVPAGSLLRHTAGRSATRRWYDLASRLPPQADARPADAVMAEYRDLLAESVRLRFRSDVPVGINLSGGVDSSTLLAVVDRIGEGTVRAFTFVTGDPAYDELPWVEEMLARTRHPLTVCTLTSAEVPGLAASVQRHQDEPFGGLPTLAYARLFERAREEGVIVLLDGQGMDEQWAGYDYYRRALGEGDAVSTTVQGTRESPLRPDCVRPELRRLTSRPECAPPAADPDTHLRSLQIHDLVAGKLPRALRFNDRISMRASTELREPFLDHRLVELALGQPVERKIDGERGKILLRRLVAELLPEGVAEAPKRPLQTPQREWLRGPLAGWAEATIETALAGWGSAWLDADAVRREWRAFRDGAYDNSFFVWQWMNLGLATVRS